MPPHVVYILQSKDKRFYIGYTNNLERRMALHKAGKGAKFTRAFGVAKLLYHEVYRTKSLAMRREYQLKQLSRDEKKKLIQRRSLTAGK